MYPIQKKVSIIFYYSAYIIKLCEHETRTLTNVDNVFQKLHDNITVNDDMEFLIYEKEELHITFYINYNFKFFLSFSDLFKKYKLDFFFSDKLHELLSRSIDGIHRIPLRNSHWSGRHRSNLAKWLPIELNLLECVTPLVAERHLSSSTLENIFDIIARRRPAARSVLK